MTTTAIPSTQAASILDNTMPHSTSTTDPHTIHLAGKSNALGGKSYIAHKRRNLWHKIHIDGFLFILLLLVAALSTWLLYSASGGSSALTQRHLLNYAVGFLLMFCVAQMSPIQLSRAADKLYVFSILLLLIVLMNDATKGSSRWINLYFINVQPSEFTKIIVPLFVATITSKYVLPLSFKTLCLSLCAIGLPAGLIYLQPDLGTTIIVVLSGLAILFFAGLSWKILLAGVAGLTVAIPIAWQFFLHPYQQKRVLTFLNPESDPFGSGWNILQSQTAIGSGGISGKGWMKGTQAQLDFLPESHTDFIFAVLAEETGFLGVSLLLLLYLLIILRCCYIAASSHTLFERLLVSGFTVVFFIYVVVNIGMTSGLLPVVGVPLPLVSYGGSSIVSLLTSFGMIMAVHVRHNRQITTSHA